MDEILLFDPFSSDQLLHGARLPMKEGEHLGVGSPGITGVLLALFNNGKRESLLLQKKIKKWQERI